MANLKYKTRGNTSPQGKPRVYFCCHPDDFEKCFKQISDKILDNQDCAIWYIDGFIERNEEFFEDLKQMQLFVMPVTTNLLCEDNSALNLDFKFAVEKHIPVLPLMQESGLDELFNKRCGELQFLDQYADDSTAISFDEKFKTYLETILIGNELAEKIREAFDAYVFLSYRKKDRRYAQELMRLIHKNDFCRDIAIWYDEFLTPGENFNDSIKEALKKSGLFVLAVTPNLVNETNYIMTTEYPMAKQAEKPILPAEIIPTDREKLSEKYADIPTPTDAHNEVELSNALLAAFEKIAVKQNDNSPEHNFFIGLAYLGGIDVEVDYVRAIELITFAADAEYLDAMVKLIDIYETGIGVAVDYSKVVFWQRKLYEALKNRLDIETVTEEELKKYSDVSFGLSSNLKRMGYGDEAIEIKRQYYDFYESYKLFHCKDNQLELIELYEELSLFYRNLDFSERAKSYAQKAFAYFENSVVKYDKKSIWLFLDAAKWLLRLCDEDEIGALLDTIKRIVSDIELSIRSSECLEELRFERLCDLFESYAGILKDTRLFDAAEKNYLKAYELISEKIDFRQAVDHRIIDRLFSVLFGLKVIKRYEDKDVEAMEYAFQIIDLRLKYIKVLDAFEPESLRKTRLISEQYGEVVKEYRYSSEYENAIHYADVHCNYLEAATIHNMTVDTARLLESAYDDVIMVYEYKEKMTKALNDEDISQKRNIVKKRINVLRFILKEYMRDLTPLYVSSKACDVEADLINAYMSVGEINEAINCSEQKLNLALERYKRTMFLLDAYNAYYDISDFYKKLEQYDKATEYFKLGMEFEVKEIKGHFTRENQERLAYLYKKIGELYFLLNVQSKGDESLRKSLEIKIDIYKTYCDFQSAKSLYYSIWDMIEHIKKRDPNGAEFLKNKMTELEQKWPELI